MVIITAEEKNLKTRVLFSSICVLVDVSAAESELSLVVEQDLPYRVIKKASIRAPGWFSG